LPEVPERSPDNTIEIIMPILAALHPGVRWAAWRVPSDLRALEFGQLAAEAVRSVGRRTAVFGSTDLTHYGYNYGFRPPDSLIDPAGWVEKRDRKFLEALAENQGGKALSLAESERSACSAGGAVAAMAFAEASGLGKGRIRSYATSRDTFRSESFVGYGTVTWDSE
jgi:AmmeMemoRadiSam system protein B